MLTALFACMAAFGSSGLIVCIRCISEVCVCTHVVVSSTSTDPEPYGSWSVTYMNPGDSVTCMIVYVLQTDTRSELLQFSLVCYNLINSLENLFQGCSRSRDPSTPATRDPLAIASFLIIHSNTVQKLMCGVCWPVRPKLCRRVLTGGCFGSL